jgi:hypothetical protein
VLYVGGLTLLGAAIAGVLPALKVTDGLGTRLREGTAGGGRRFGGLWTAVIVTQIAVTAAFPALAVVEQWELLRIRSADVGFRSEQYVAMQLELDAAVGPGADTGAARAAHRIRYGATLEELRRRVAAEPDVAGITFVDRLPHMYHPERRIEVQDASAVAGPDGAALSAVPRDSLPEASIALIDPTYFDVLQAPVLAGRGFNNGDVAHAAPVAIVDRSFVEQVLRGRNAIGRRVRFAAMQNAADGEADEPHPWFEIVGVVKDLGMTHPSHRSRAAGIYLPGGLESNNPFYMVVHARGDPMALVPQVRAIAAAVDPTLRLSEIQRVDQLTDGVLWFLGLWLRITLLLTAIALLLSLSGIYAVMSFTVARRTREIGIRVALGANARTVIASIFRRPLAQVGVGVGAGTLLAGLMFLAGRHATVGAHFTVSARGVALLALYAALILGVCLLACVAPTRRALAVQPMEALRVE